MIKVYFKKQFRLNSLLLGWDGTVDAVRMGTKTLKILRPVSEKEAENVSVLHFILLICLRVPNESKLSLKGQWNDYEAGAKVTNPLGLTVLGVVTSLIQFEH